MKISELAAYRKTLEDLRLDHSLEAIAKDMDPVIYQIANRSPKMPSALQTLQTLREQTKNVIQQFDHERQRIIDEIIEQIKGLEPSYLARSYQLYEEGLNYDTVDHILNRRFPIAPDVKTYVQSRVQAYSDYHHAGMIIRPGLEDWIEHMVACDPLYVVDTNHDLFGPTKEKFNPMYQARLRYYAICESSDQTMLDLLPDSQFGFVLAYNFFHYKPFEIIRAYLREIYQKLRPGGALAMTYTDGDRRGGAELAERMMNCYTPGRLITGACESAGFILERLYQLDAAVNWVELRKPGTTQSLRAGQTLAKIVAKSK